MSGYTTSIVLIIVGSMMVYISIMKENENSVYIPYLVTGVVSVLIGIGILIGNL